MLERADVYLFSAITCVYLGPTPSWSSICGYRPRCSSSESVWNRCHPSDRYIRPPWPYPGEYACSQGLDQADQITFSSGRCGIGLSHDGCIMQHGWIVLDCELFHRPAQEKEIGACIQICKD
jgi:hypothetical protein